MGTASEGRAPVDDVDAIRADWRRLAPQLDTEVIDTVGRILRAAALLTRRGDEFLAGFGLARGEFDILSALRRADAPQSPGTLRTVSLASGPAVTKRLRGLEERRLLERSPNPADGRGALIALTPAGEELIDRVFPRLLDLENALLAGVPAGARAHVVPSLRAVLASIDGAQTTE
ncbi:MarR family winged helix-turn-helix transcriptional regulator [Herbiconiux sp. YIM B11900]|uniref:MarR family winged helix-turn-helix transcriptional regulator n=1 Tax=Herbiconiux sp. YIM B11900 TaxID=3404131 RepID=UPI003F841066